MNEFLRSHTRKWLSWDFNPICLLPKLAFFFLNNTFSLNIAKYQIIKDRGILKRIKSERTLPKELDLEVSPGGGEKTCKQPRNGEGWQDAETWWQVENGVRMRGHHCRLIFLE